jgi:hypothetical protein
MDISQLNEEAKAAGVFVTSGASSVPALSSAVIGVARRHMERENNRNIKRNKHVARHLRVRKKQRVRQTDRVEKL